MKYQFTFSYYFSDKNVDEINKQVLTQRIIQHQKKLGNTYSSNQIKIGEFGVSHAHPKGVIVIGEWEIV